MTDRGRHGGREGADAALVAAIAAGRPAREAARTAGVSERTVVRRLTDPSFRQQVDEARAEILSQTVARLTGASVEAVETLRALLGSPLDFARLAAARSILDIGLKYRDQYDLAERVSALEDRVTRQKEAR